MNEPVRFPWDMPALPIMPAAELDAPAAQPKPRGRRPGSATIGQGRPTAPDWLFHHLTISGPAEQVQAFAVGACGSGVVPWRLEGTEIEDTVFNLAVSQPTRDRNLTIEGCRILARQFRDRVEARQARAAARVGHSRACPFDLHTLLPVPDAILQLGPTHPTARAWLTAHWGVTDRLRQVSLLAKPTTGRRLAVGHRVIGYGFFTLGDTPRAAITQLAAGWPMLRFRIGPRVAD